jgi:hypothetical protein
VVARFGQSRDCTGNWPKSMNKLHGVQKSGRVHKKFCFDSRRRRKIAKRMRKVWSKREKELQVCEVTRWTARAGRAIVDRSWKRVAGISS